MGLVTRNALRSADPPGSVVACGEKCRFRIRTRKSEPGSDFGCLRTSLKLVAQLGRPSASWDLARSTLTSTLNPPPLPFRADYRAEHGGYGDRGFARRPAFSGIFTDAVLRSRRAACRGGDLRTDGATGGPPNARDWAAHGDRRNAVGCTADGVTAGGDPGGRGRGSGNL